MAFPRIFQRLFANSGAGPKLRHDIIPWDEESRITSLEALAAGHDRHAHADGKHDPAARLHVGGRQFRLVRDVSGTQSQVTMRRICRNAAALHRAEGDISAHPGKFKPDAANPTGLSFLA